LTHKETDTQENPRTYESFKMASKEPIKATSGTTATISDVPANEKRYNRRGGRGGGRGNGSGRQAQNQSYKVANLFKGGIAEMNGHTFQCYGETTERNQYNRTLEELEVYVGAHI
jgi:hypothetical protein